MSDQTPPAGADPWATPGGSAGQPAPGPAGVEASAYGQPAYGQPAYGQPAYGQPAYGEQGPVSVGKVRGTGTCILLAVVTLSIYVYVYNYKIHKEMKEHSGRGIGGGIALLLTFVANVAMPFVTSAEVGSLYTRRGEPEPVSGWTGLWVILPAVTGYIGLFGALIAASEALDSAEGSDVLFLVLVVAFLVAAVGGAVVWFVKTNGALNRYWASLGAR